MYVLNQLSVAPNRRLKINHVHAVCRFINYLINTYVSPRYMDGTPEELSRYALQLSKRLSAFCCCMWRSRPAFNNIH